MDILIRDILAVLPDGVRICSVCVHDGLISAVGDVPDGFVPEKTISGTGRLLIPGLVNAHTHAYMTVFRNCADDLKFSDWLFGRILPMEDQLTDEDCYWGSMLGITEMISTGTTSFLDMMIFIDGAARAAADTGIRAVLSRGLTGDCDEDSGGFRRIREQLDAIKRWSGHDNISFMLAPHAPYTCTEAYLKYVGDTAREYGLPIHIHLAEGESESDTVMKEHCCSPVEYIDSLGLLNSRTVAAHCVRLSDSDIDILAQRGVTVATNPVSNLKLANGFARIPDMLRAGIKVVLGTDGAASNNTLNLFREMSFLSLIHKGTSCDPQAVTAAETFRAATATGARALGINAGEIRVGMAADLAILDIDRPNMQPLADPVAALCYSASGYEVETVMVDGKLLMERGELLTIDRERVYAECAKICERIGTK